MPPAKEGVRHQSQWRGVDVDGPPFHQIDEAPTFDLYVESSFVGYMKLWFDTASGKLGS